MRNPWSAQKIEFVFSASPETNRWESRELPPSPSPVTCGTWQPAHRMILMFFPSWGGFHAAAVPLNSPVSTKFCFLRSTASM
jgi:hypothetical protein